MVEEDVISTESSGNLGLEVPCPSLPPLSPLSDLDSMSGSEDEVPVRDGLSLFPSGDSLGSSVDALPPLSPLSFDGDDIYLPSSSVVNWPNPDAEMKSPVDFASLCSDGLGSESLFDSQALKLHESKFKDFSLARINKQCPTTPLDSSDGAVSPTVLEGGVSPTALAETCPADLSEFMDMFEETLPDTVHTADDVLEEVKTHFRGKEVGNTFLFLMFLSDQTFETRGSMYTYSSAARPWNVPISFFRRCHCPMTARSQ